MQALVLSGGGSRGAFQVGALKFLAEQGQSYDLFCGISVGAINAAHLSMFADFSEAVVALEALWRRLTTASVHRRWFPFGYAHALWKLSARDSRPLQELLRAEYDPAATQAANKQLRVGAVSLRDHSYRLFTEADPGIVEAVIGSSAFPGMLTPGWLDGQWWVDGGVRNVTPLKAAIDAGADAVDVVMASASLPVHNPDPRSTFDVLTRSLSAMLDEILATDIKMALLYNDLIGMGAAPDKRAIEIRMVQPTGPLPGEGLEFEPPDIAAMINVGYEHAREQLG